MLAQWFNACLGLWLMGAPSALGFGGLSVANDHVIGPLAAGCALIAAHEVMRPLRWINVPLGAWMILSPACFHDGAASALNSVLVGLMLCLLAPHGASLYRATAGGWPSLWRWWKQHRPRTAAT
jgi:hypothetical protein